MSNENPYAIQQVPLQSEMWGYGVIQLPWMNFRKCCIIYLCDARHVGKQKGVNLMCACKETDMRKSPNDSTLAGGEGHGSRGETCHPHCRENPVSSSAERGVQEYQRGKCIIYIQYSA
jgi:hypothetical protein